MERNKKSGSTSLRPGDEVIVINLDDQQAQEEQEALDDQRRIQQEIKNVLATGLDEFNYDDQSTINSSIFDEEQQVVTLDDVLTETAISVTECISPSSPDTQERQKTSEEIVADEVERSASACSERQDLKVLYKLRVKEVHELQEEITMLKCKAAEKNKIANKKLFLMEDENITLKIAFSKAKHLLAEKDDKITMLEKELDILKKKNEDLQRESEQFENERSSYKSTLNALEKKIESMHSTPFYPTSHEATLSMTQETQRNNIEKLNSYIMDLSNKLTEMEREKAVLLTALAKRTGELELGISERRTVIATLTGNLEEAQAEVNTLSDSIELLRRQNEELNKKIKHRIKHCNCTIPAFVPTVPIPRNPKTTADISQVQRLESVRKHLRTELERSNNLVRDKSEQLKKLEFRVNHDTHLKKELGHKVELLEKKIKEKTDTINNLRALNKNYASHDSKSWILEIDRLRKDLSDARDRINQLEEAEEDPSELKAENVDLQMEKHILAGKVVKLEVENRTLVQERDTAVNNLIDKGNLQGVAMISNPLPQSDETDAACSLEPRRSESPCTETPVFTADYAPEQFYKDELQKCLNKLHDVRKSVSKMVEVFKHMLDLIEQDKQKLQGNYRDLINTMQLQIQQRENLARDNRNLKLLLESAKDLYGKTNQQVVLSMVQLFDFLKDSLKHTSLYVHKTSIQADAAIFHVEAEFASRVKKVRESKLELDNEPKSEQDGVEQNNLNLPLSNTATPPTQIPGNLPVNPSKQN